MINPITGYTDTVQNVLNDFYNYFNYYALTCIEYDGLNLTANMYDAKISHVTSMIFTLKISDRG